MAKRIITITSGKGGVGKTTLAINLGLALSRYGRTVLIDRDLETGSVRSFLGMSFARDLYHVIARNAPLESCITPLPPTFDPHGQFPNFGIIAAPRHFIDDFPELMARSKQRLIDSIHALPADFVILDMRAGLSDENVESMPYSNSGILVFTPRLPAAAGAAANLIKAQIFRKLYLAIRPPSPLVEDLPAQRVDEILELIHRADDVYDDEVPNLDTVVMMLTAQFGDHPVTRAIRRMLGSFYVHYVLNHFDGVQDSYQRAVRPFVEQLAEIVSARLDVRNLGWVEYNPAIHDANCRRLPALLYEDLAGRTAEQRHEAALAEIEQMVAGIEPKAPSGGATAAGVSRYLTDQLEHLEKMHRQVGSIQYPTQFEYLAAAARYRMRELRPYSFGDTRILTQREIHEMMMRHYRHA
jgi:MinD-like ATPase involved in chromosome partitioning or flagellar assembly